MGYSLGIDLGATSCSAAIRRAGAIEVCALGEAGAPMPAVALPGAGGTTLVAEAADRQSAYEPALVARMVAARVGGPDPIELDGVTIDPPALTAALLGEVVDRAAAAAGGPPERVVVTYPLRATDELELLLADAAARAVGPAAMLVPAPIAAVARLAHARDLGPQTVVAVVDVGGASVEVTLVRRTAEAFDLIGDPLVHDDLGGTDLDAAMLTLVERAIGDLTSAVTPGDYAGMIALRRVRASCRAAKERLSTDEAAVVEVALPHARGRVEVTREAFQRAIAPAIADVAALVSSTIEDAGLIAADVDLVLLTGGSAHVPGIRDRIAAHTGVEVVVEPAPESTVALGAVLFADVDDGSAPGPVTGPVPVAPAPVDLPADAGPADLTAALAALPGAGAVPDASPTGPGPAVDDWAPPAAPGQPGAPFDEWGPPHPATTGGWPQVGADGTGGWATAPADGAGDGAWPDEQPWEAQPADAWADPAGPWDDARTSVFDPAPPAAPAPAAGDWDPPGDADDRHEDEFARLTTSDTDPFGSRGGGTLATRLRSRQEGDDEDYDDADAGIDIRLVVGGVVAAVAVVLIAGFALLSGGGGDEPAIAVADAGPITTTTRSLTSTTTTTEPTTTTESTTTTTTEEPTGTTRPRRTTTTTTAPTTTAPPATAPPTTRPTTTTTRPTTTTSTSTTTPTSTTVCPDPPPDPPTGCDDD